MSLNEAIDDAEQVICPARGTRIVWKVVALVLSIMFAAFLLRMVGHYLWRTEDVGKTVTLDRVWFARNAEEIRALGLEIKAAQEALERKQKEAGERWISRSDDRIEFDRLNNHILELQKRRAEQIRDYNAACLASVDSGIAPIGTE